MALTCAVKPGHLLVQAPQLLFLQITGVRGQDCAWSCVLPQPWDKATQPCTPGSDQGNREARPFLARGTGGQAQLPHSCQALMLHCGHWFHLHPCPQLPHKEGWARRKQLPFLRPPARVGGAGVAPTIFPGVPRNHEASSQNPEGLGGVGGGGLELAEGLPGCP